MGWFNQAFCSSEEGRDWNEHLSILCEQLFGSFIVSVVYTGPFLSTGQKTSGLDSHFIKTGLSGEWKSIRWEVAERVAELVESPRQKEEAFLRFAKVMDTAGVRDEIVNK